MQEKLITIKLIIFILNAMTTYNSESKQRFKNLKHKNIKMLESVEYLNTENTKDIETTTKRKLKAANFHI